MLRAKGGRADTSGPDSPIYPKEQFSYSTQTKTRGGIKQGYKGLNMHILSTEAATDLPSISANIDGSLRGRGSHQKSQENDRSLSLDK